MTEWNWKILEPLEYKKALERMGGMEHLYMILVENFINDYSDFPSRLSLYIEEKSDQAYVITHSLKNIAASLGAASLADAAELMEDFFRNSNFDGNELYLKNLLEELQDLLELLKQLPLKRENEEKTSISKTELLYNCREALNHFSPGEIKKCREILVSLPFQDQEKALVGELLGLLKMYKYKEAKEILDQLEALNS